MLRMNEWAFLTDEVFEALLFVSMISFYLLTKYRVYIVYCQQSNLHRSRDTSSLLPRLHFSSSWSVQEFYPGRWISECEQERNPVLFSSGTVTGNRKALTPSWKHSDSPFCPWEYALRGVHVIKQLSLAVSWNTISKQSHLFFQRTLEQAVDKKNS